MVGWVLAESLHLVMDQWIQYKLGKQYLVKKITLPWESNPGPTPIRGGPVTIIASAGLKYIFGYFEEHGWWRSDIRETEFSFFFKIGGIHSAQTWKYSSFEERPKFSKQVLKESTCGSISNLANVRTFPCDSQSVKYLTLFFPHRLIFQYYGWINWVCVGWGGSIIWKNVIGNIFHQALHHKDTPKGIFTQAHQAVIQKGLGILTLCLANL